MAEDKTREALQQADEAKRLAEQAMATAKASLSEDSEENQAKMQAEGDLAREIVSLVRKTPQSRDGLVANLSGKYESEEQLDALLAKMTLNGQLYEVGKGESQHYRAGLAQ